MEKIKIEAIIRAKLATTWETWTDPNHIIQWNQASNEWHCPSASNDLRKDGRFSYRMEAKDGSFGFDFSGQYSKVVAHKEIVYTLDDGRVVSIAFSEEGDDTRIVQVFEAEDQNTIEMQKGGWQAILNSFKGHAEMQD
jgi:uncharacterized protein YndB with AHSA1/START domain